MVLRDLQLRVFADFSFMLLMTISGSVSISVHFLQFVALHFWLQVVLHWGETFIVYNCIADQWIFLDCHDVFFSSMIDFKSSSESLLIC